MNVIEGDEKNDTAGTREYPEDFGKKSEAIIANALKRRFSPLIKKTEKATPYEDQREGTDIWIDFGEAGVVAVQLTFTDSEKELQEKIKKIRLRPLAKKQERPDALINYTRNAHLVLAKYNKNDIAAASKLYEEKIKKGENVSMEELVSDKVLLGIMGQIINGLPGQTKATVAKEMAKMKRVGE